MFCQATDENRMFEGLPWATTTYSLALLSFFGLQYDFRIETRQEQVGSSSVRATAVGRRLKSRVTSRPI